MHSAPEGFYFQASNGSVALPVAGYDYNSVWTPLLAGLSPAGMAASLAAPEPYGPNSGIRLPPWVCDGKAFFVTVCRMRSSACDTLTRLCVRRVLCWLAFPLASASMIRKRNVPSDQMLVGTAWYAKKPVTTCFNQCPCS